MKNKTINSIIGRTIKEIRIRSFYLDLELVCEIISLFIRVDTEVWYKFSMCDGENFIEIFEEEPKEIMLNEIQDEFAYPIKTISSNYVDRKIIDIKEYIYKNLWDELNGFYIKLDNETGFSYFEENDCPMIFDGIKIDKEYSFVSSDQ